MNTKFLVIGLLGVVALLVSACGVAQPLVAYRQTPAPGYGYGPDMMGNFGGGPSGMMGGGYGYQNNTPLPGNGYGPGMMGGGHMMGGYGYGQTAPTAEPTPIGATPAPVDEEIQITASNLRVSPAQITVKPGETVRFVVTNNDSFLHNFVSQEAGIPFLALPGGTTQTVTWTAPAQ
ncbi:MAG: cupredoxin domain-containing protein, partial [Chloroflexi bacterium]|nr:cupredoxin domain-containing protein [Chloroflexota bacterium]